MKTKWKVFLITFLSYSFIQASRTSWSTLKYTLNSSPFVFSPVYLGTLDMLVLVTLAISLVLLGPKIVRGGPSSYLRKGIMSISIVIAILGLCLLFNVTSRYLYLLIYPLVGLFSCVGWPSCIYVLFYPFRFCPCTLKKELYSLCGMAASNLEISLSYS